jgi:hypothetical protein
LSTSQWVTTYSCVPHCEYANRGNCCTWGYHHQTLPKEDYSKATGQ